MRKQDAIGAGLKTVGVRKNERGGVHGVGEGQGVALAKRRPAQKRLDYPGWGFGRQKKGPSERIFCQRLETMDYG
jgi:hypothetical protein